MHIYFNPRTPCGVRLIVRPLLQKRIDISIHAPRAGCDTLRHTHTTMLIISIHAPRAGCDDSYHPGKAIVDLFQSTHPVRGATPTPLLADDRFLFQSTHPVRGATCTLRA